METETAEEEGAVGGIDRLHDHQTSKNAAEQHLVTNQIVRCPKVFILSNYW